jgi:hypothetical protein
VGVNALDFSWVSDAGLLQASEDLLNAPIDRNHMIE